MCRGGRGLDVVIADLHEGEPARLWAAAGACAWGPPGGGARRGPLASPVPPVPAVCIKVGVGSGALPRETEADDAGACEGAALGLLVLVLLLMLVMVVLVLCGGAEPGRVERKGRVVRPGRRAGLVAIACCCCCCSANISICIYSSSISASQCLLLLLLVVVAPWEEDTKAGAGPRGCSCGGGWSRCSWWNMLPQSSSPSVPAWVPRRIPSSMSMSISISIS